MQGRAAVLAMAHFFEDDAEGDRSGYDDDEGYDGDGCGEDDLSFITDESEVGENERMHHEVDAALALEAAAALTRRRGERDGDGGGSDFESASDSGEDLLVWGRRRRLLGGQHGGRSSESDGADVDESDGAASVASANGGRRRRRRRVVDSDEESHEAAAEGRRRPRAGVLVSDAEEEEKATVNTAVLHDMIPSRPRQSSSWKMRLLWPQRTPSISAEIPEASVDQGGSRLETSGALTSGEATKACVRGVSTYEMLRHTLLRPRSPAHILVNLLPSESDQVHRLARARVSSLLSLTRTLASTYDLGS